jgi:exopolysaccharide biosynthesis polyprenyl glycosylphosphotransferase
LVIFRNLARYIRILLFRYDFGITNILIVGDTSVTHELVDSLYDSHHSGYRIVGVVGNKATLGQYSGKIRLFGSFDEATKSMGAKNIYTIVQTELFADETKNQEILTFCQANHIGYRFTPGNSELFVGNIEVELFRSAIPVIAVHQTALFGWGRIVKRLFDLVVSGLLIVILSPLLLFIALAIKLFDPGPVFFRQKRLTRFGQEAKILKFRTMKTAYSGKDPVVVFKEMGRPDLAEEFQNNRAKVTDDPRVSKFGRFLRSTSLDELPQLINVFKGPLSLVGPRSIPREELAYFKDKGPLVLNVKTGITGLAQVSGRSNISIDERLKLDLYYVQNWSFWMDIVILLKTIRVVFARRGVR